LAELDDEGDQADQEEDLDRPVTSYSVTLASSTHVLARVIVLANVPGNS
jgi:hypothetical protein